MIAALVAIYVVGAIFTYGFVKGIAIKKFPSIDFNRLDESMTIFISVIWPIGLPAFTAIWSDCSTRYWCIRFRK